MQNRQLKTLLLAIVLLVTTACGAQSPEAAIVEVTLTEFGIESAITTFEAGQPYRFVITNSGMLPHEFTIMQPGPTVEGMEGMDHNIEGTLLHVGQDELAPGARVSVEYTFTEGAALGSIEFACHVTGHYEAGMHTPLTVNS